MIQYGWQLKQCTLRKNYNFLINLTSAKSISPISNCADRVARLGQARADLTSPTMQAFICRLTLLLSPSPSQPAVGSNELASGEPYQAGCLRFLSSWFSEERFLALNRSHLNTFTILSKTLSVRSRKDSGVISWTSPHPRVTPITN